MCVCVMEGVEKCVCVCGGGGGGVHTVKYIYVPYII